jgi:CDP-paratose 2-epimerase
VIVADSYGGIGRPARVLITGGAGFIGTNLVRRLSVEGTQVRVFDSLARPGSERNVQWILENCGDQVEFVRGDVRDPDALDLALADVDHIYHLAAQVAVTTSLLDPVSDFDINARGTLNVLEAARRAATPPSIVFASTNKVYGALSDIELTRRGNRYEPQNEQLLRYGVGETRPLEFHSPYGCSKGAADQYVLDYARSFDLRAVVMRMSCIYGPHQNGTEDQGWVAHVTRCALENEAVTVFGDGCQVRDLLFVDDLVDAFECARVEADSLRGRAFNLGGGPANVVSLLELIDRNERNIGRSTRVAFENWRVGDQRYYVSDTRSFGKATGWRATTSVESGLEALRDWLQQVEPTFTMPAPDAPVGDERRVPR